jgi:hypothetical protein
MKILRVILRFYVYCSTVILEVCDLVRLLWFLCDNRVKNKWI